MKTASDWLAAERFIYNTMPAGLLLGTVLFFVLIFLLLYIKKETFRFKYPVVVAFMALIAGLAFFLLQGFQQNEWYTIDVRKVSPVIRDRKKNIFKYDYTETRPPSIYDQENIESLDLYNATPVIGDETITYVGATEHLYYFKVYSKLYKLNKNNEFMVFTEGIKEPRFIGLEYTLKDDSFSEIGFFKDVGPLYTELQIPASLADLTYNHISGETDQYHY